MLSSFLDPRRFKFKKLRLLLAWLGGILLILNTHINDESFRLGIPFILLGEFIRILSSGYLERKGKKLATSGPFAFVRNPLYIGNFILGLGVVLVSNNLFNFALFIIGFSILYFGTVKKEEGVLSTEFGADYADYIREVPRFFPRFTPYSKTSRDPFQWKSVIKHREYITVAGIVIVIAGFYIFEELREGERIEHLWKMQTAGGFIIAAVIFLVCEWIRKEIQKKETR